MKKLNLCEKVEKETLYTSVRREYESLAGLGLRLDLSRGKPNAMQLDASQGLMEVELRREDCFSESGRRILIEEFS